MKNIAKSNHSSLICRSFKDNESEFVTFLEDFFVIDILAY